MWKIILHCLHSSELDELIYFTTLISMALCWKAARAIGEQKMILLLGRNRVSRNRKIFYVGGLPAISIN